MDREITLNHCWLLLEGSSPYKDKHQEVIERVHMSQWSFTGSEGSRTGGLHGQQLLTQKAAFDVFVWGNSVF